MLYPYNNLFLASVVAGEAARKRFTERAGNTLELYTDFLDLSRFAEQPHEVRTVRYLADKYRDRKPDIKIQEERLRIAGNIACALREVGYQCSLGDDSIAHRLRDN